MTVYVYVGPTLPPAEVSRTLPRAVIRPPVRHGDLLELHAVAGDTVLIIDGLFHQCPPVRYKEILHLMDAGVRVVGSSSMGALRAAELCRYGMVGVGWVYHQYVTAAINDDSEVAVTHLDDEPYTAVTEPLVNFRYALDRAADACIPRDAAVQLLDIARAVPYWSRSWGLVLRRALDDGAVDDRTVGSLRAWLSAGDHADIKRRDAVEALAAIRDGSFGGDTRAALWESWRTTRLLHWISRFSVADHADGPVPQLALLQYEQLYSPEFPSRWRRYVLAWIAGLREAVIEHRAAVPDAVLEQCAVARAQTYGLDAEALLRHAPVWLSPEESRGLSERERVLRVLVRSGAMGVGIEATHGRVYREYLLGGRDGQVDMVAAALRANVALEESDSRKSVHALRPSRLQQALEKSWSLREPAQAALDAAARDRGFESFAAALDISRYFYLSRREQAATPSSTGAA
jgi:hypothetical protein